MNDNTSEDFSVLDKYNKLQKQLNSAEEKYNRITSAFAHKESSKQIAYNLNVKIYVLKDEITKLIEKYPELGV